MDLSNFTLSRLTPDKEILHFDCGDTDLNEFLLSDCKHYHNELLAVTYILEDRDSTVAFFSVLNDKISITDMESNRKWASKIKDVFPSRKRYKSYPAVKVGRFAVSNQYKGKAIGTALLDYVKFLFIDKNKTGCRFITVDAYKDSLEFYNKNNFLYMTESDKDMDTRLMYYDLSNLTSE